MWSSDVNEKKKGKTIALCGKVAKVLKSLTGWVCIHFTLARKVFV